MALRVLKGSIAGFKRRRAEASFVFTDSDRDGLGVIAIAASLTGLSGQAIGTAHAAGSTEEEADFLEFEIEGKPTRGWVWRNPFKEGDSVEVVCEEKGDHWEILAISQPSDRKIALYPHCSRGKFAHWQNALKWWFFGTSVFLLIGGLFLEVVSFLAESRSAFFGGGGGGLVVFLLAFFYSVFALMTWALARKWMPFVRLSEKVFAALGLEDPSKIDLVKSSKAQRRPDDPPEYGVFYFRY